MGYPKNTFFIIIYVHHMEIDALFDFLNDRTDTPPDYWLNKNATPPSISGGYAEINMCYEQYTNLRRVKEHNF